MGFAESVWHEIQNPVLYALPVFALFVGIEAFLLRHEQRQDLRGYSAIDTRTSVSMGVVSLLFTAVFKAATLILLVFLHQYVAPWHIPTDTWWSWVLLFVVVDLAWYGYHRFAHRVRIGWAGHQAHHSSEYFNFGTALRQKWNPWFDALFWMPLPVLGFAPWAIYIAFAVNLIYQFFTHTEAIGRLPRPVEFILNTPSHHRVHHASDPEYLDRNYGGILIIWDRMFGTFRQEGALRPTGSPSRSIPTTCSNCSTASTARSSPMCGGRAAGATSWASSSARPAGCLHTRRVSLCPKPRRSRKLPSANEVNALPTGPAEAQCCRAENQCSRLQGCSACAT